MWIAFTAFLQWSYAEEDNIHEVGISGVEDKDDGDPAVVQEISDAPPDEAASMTTTEMPEKMPEVTQPPSEMSSTMDQHSEETKPEPPHSEETKPEPPNSEETKPQPNENAMESPNNVPQSGEDLKEPSKTPEPPIEISESSQEKIPLTGQTPPEESSSEVGKDSSEEPQPQISAGKTPEFENPKTSTDGADYPNDAPQDITTVRPSPPIVHPPVPPPVLPPVFMNISCYTCTFCDGSVKNQPKTKCPPKKNQRNGCFSVFVRDAKIAPGKDKYLARGCLSDLEESLLEYCGKNAALCSKCYDHDCNSQDISTYEAVMAGAGSHIAYLSITLTIWCLGWNWMNYQMQL